MSDPNPSLVLADAATKMQYLEAHLLPVLREIGAMGLVGILRFEEDEDTSAVAFRVPGCPSSCDDEIGCTVRIFHDASEDLAENSHRLQHGEVKLLANESPHKA